MSEKVLLTEDQATEIEAMKNLGYSLNDWESMRKESPNSVAFKISLEEFARAWLSGYEIKQEKPKFEAGDKVFFDSQILTLDTLARNPLGRDGDEGKAWRLKEVIGWLGENQIRHATEKEIFWLHEMGRDKVGDFREGDVVLAEGNKTIRLIDDWLFKNAARWYEEDLITGIYPAESFKPFDK